jgi:hypothetical protein
MALQAAFSESSPEWAALHPKRQRYGLRFEWDHLGDCWVYYHDLLWRIYEEFGNSEWADEAFLLLMRHGFDTSAGCGKPADQFRNVIGRGEAFLDRNLAHAHRLEALRRPGLL